MRKCKPKKCRWCSNEFFPWNSTQVNCSPPCAIEYIKHKQDTQLRRDIRTDEKVKRKELKQRKEKLKSRSDHLKTAQTACNAYIRERDGKICISCGTQKPDIQYCAGHMKTRGAHPSLRFHPFNINSQCNKRCNLMLSGNVAEYEKNLTKKIGQDNVDWLNGPHEPQKLTVEDIKEITVYYREQLKILRSGK